MPQTRPLNPKQLKFAQLFIASGKIQESYEKAGFKARGASAASAGSLLLKNVEIIALIEQATGKAVHTAELNAAYVIAGLKKEANFYGDGSQHSARIKAYELLGDAVKMWGDDMADVVKEMDALKALLQAVRDGGGNSTAKSLPERTTGDPPGGGGDSERPADPLPGGPGEPDG